MSRCSVCCCKTVTVCTAEPDCRACWVVSLLVPRATSPLTSPPSSPSRPPRRRAHPFPAPEFVGCSPSLSGAIRVNPWSIESVADGMYSALKTSKQDRWGAVCILYNIYVLYIVRGREGGGRVAEGPGAGAASARAARRRLDDRDAAALMQRIQPRAPARSKCRFRARAPLPRRLRHDKHWRYVSQHTVAFWAQSYVTDLVRRRRRFIALHAPACVCCVCEQARVHTCACMGAHTDLVRRRRGSRFAGGCMRAPACVFELYASASLGRHTLPKLGVSPPRQMPPNPCPQPYVCARTPTLKLARRASPRGTWL